MAGMKPNKNNPSNKSTKKEPKVISSTICESCKHQDQCKEFIKYKKAFLIRGIGYGVKCSL